VILIKDAPNIFREAERKRGLLKGREFGMGDGRRRSIAIRIFPSLEPGSWQCRSGHL
jgi:hypothetical protein